LSSGVIPNTPLQNQKVKDQNPKPLNVAPKHMGNTDNYKRCLKALKPSKEAFAKDALKIWSEKTSVQLGRHIYSKECGYIFALLSGHDPNHVKTEPEIQISGFDGLVKLSKAITKAQKEL
jgi:hypothetical protein